MSFPRTQHSYPSQGSNPDHSESSALLTIRPPRLSPTHRISNIITLFFQKFILCLRTLAGDLQVWPLLIYSFFNLQLSSAPNWMMTARIIVNKLKALTYLGWAPCCKLLQKLHFSVFSKNYERKEVRTESPYADDIAIFFLCRQFQ